MNLEFVCSNDITPGIPTYVGSVNALSDEQPEQKSILKSQFLMFLDVVECFALICYDVKLFFTQGNVVESLL